MAISNVSYGRKWPLMKHHCDGGPDHGGPHHGESDHGCPDHGYPDHGSGGLDHGGVVGCRFMCNAR